MPTEFQRRIANFAARRLFLDGIQLRDQDWRAQPYRPGSRHLMFQQDRNGISRPVAHLHQRNEAFTIDLFPPLWSVKIVAITEHGMRLDGWEALAQVTGAKRGMSCSLIAQAALRHQRERFNHSSPRRFARPEVQLSLPACTGETFLT